jgi:tetratricopeptide (TPR) repeat protein
LRAPADYRVAGLFQAKPEMNTRNVGIWIAIVVVLLGFATVWRLQQKIDVQFAALHEERDEMLLRSGKLVKLLSLEYSPLMANLYWTRVVQYYGEKQRTHDPNLEELWPLLDATTTIDPQLLIPYRFGSTFLSEPKPRGAGRPDLAVRLIERGIKENPEYWRFYQDLGNIYYFDLKDYDKASEAFRIGGEKPGAHFWMKSMAAKIAAEGESLETSLLLWKDIYETAKDPDVRKNAGIHIQLLNAELDCKRIDSLVDEYTKRHGRRPSRISELVQAGLLPRVPVDPVGHPYVLDENGKAQLSVDSPLLEQQLMNPFLRHGSPPS